MRLGILGNDHYQMDTPTLAFSKFLVSHLEVTFYPSF